ncbi:MAG: hypothetical protein QNK05_09230 [Myxococcota bacterium]|nr:hypothetical protein [Myxococcota bacterium]
MTLGLLAALLVALATPSFAEPPKALAYQGQLLDAAGDPPVEPTIQVRIFDALTDGTALFSEEHGAVSVAADGRFELSIGNGTPIQGSLDASLFSDPNRFLELSVDGEVLAPRQRLGSVGFALRAAEASQVAGIPVFEVFDGAGQRLGTLLSSRDFRATNVKIQGDGGRSLEVLSDTGIQFQVDTVSGQLGVLGYVTFVTDDCSGPPLVSIGERGRLVQVLRPTEDDLFAFVPADAQPLPPVVPGSSTDSYFNCLDYQGGPIPNLVQSEDLPADLGFTLPLTPIVTTQPR